LGGFKFLSAQYSTQQSVLVINVDGTQRRAKKDFDLN